MLSKLTELEHLLPVQLWEARDPGQAEGQRHPCFQVSRPGDFSSLRLRRAVKHPSSEVPCGPLWQGLSNSLLSHFQAALRAQQPRRPCLTGLAPYGNIPTPRRAGSTSVSHPCLAKEARGNPPTAQPWDLGSPCFEKQPDLKIRLPSPLQTRAA